MMIEYVNMVLTKSTNTSLVEYTKMDALLDYYGISILYDLKCHDIR